MCAGMVFAACCTGFYGCWISGSLFGLMSAFSGCGIALIVGMLPTMLLALIPEQKIQYHGEKDSPPDSTVASVVAYLAGGP